MKFGELLLKSIGIDGKVTKADVNSFDSQIADERCPKFELGQHVNCIFLDTSMVVSCQIKRIHLFGALQDVSYDIEVAYKYDLQQGGTNIAFTRIYNIDQALIR